MLRTRSAIAVRSTLASGVPIGAAATSVIVASGTVSAPATLTPETASTEEK
jgi:hypothetical protein